MTFNCRKGSPSCGWGRSFIAGVAVHQSSRALVNICQLKRHCSIPPALQGENPDPPERLESRPPGIWQDGPVMVAAKLIWSLFRTSFLWSAA